MKPIDPQLIRRLGSVRRLLIGSVVLSAVSAAAIVGQAVAIAHILSLAIGGAPDTAGFPATEWFALGIAIAVRAGTGLAGERIAGAAAGAAIGRLREQLLSTVSGRGSRWRASTSAAALLPLLTTGMDGLHGYLGRYLPALVTAVVIPPAILLVLLSVDPLSALLVAFTLPLVPLFMALVGSFTRAATSESLNTIGALAGRFADVLAGLPALVVFGRVRAQADAVAAAAERHRLAVGRTLRVAFLSSMVLELIATLSVALVAVVAGLRLAGGSLGIETALVVLLLAPEAYLPLRAVGTRFHAAGDGAAAVTMAWTMVDRAPTTAGIRTDTAEVPGLRWQDAAVDFGRGSSLQLGSRSITAGAITVLHGASGSGKTTVLNLLAGLDSPDNGTVLVGGADGGWLDLSEVDRRHWRDQLGWLGQRATLLPGTMRDNLTAGRQLSVERIDTVLSACRLTALLAELPSGLQTVIGPGGRQLSTGQRRRIGLARALLTDAPVLLLDEPTEGLDEATETALLQNIRPLLSGRTVVITTHRPAVLAMADQRIDVTTDRQRAQVGSAQRQPGLVTA